MLCEEWGVDRIRVEIKQAGNLHAILRRAGVAWII
jgi:hypothetical protein